MHVYLSGNHFQQNKVIIPNNNNAINIYCVYKLDPIASSRDTIFTIQNALFGAMQITKNADTSKCDYKGYGICFDEGTQFGHTIIGQIIFMLWVTDLQKVFMTLRYIQKKMFYRNFADPGKKFMLSLHYNGNNGYLFVNGRQEVSLSVKQIN